MDDASDDAPTDPSSETSAENEGGRVSRLISAPGSGISGSHGFASEDSEGSPFTLSITNVVARPGFDQDALARTLRVTSHEEPHGVLDLPLLVSRTSSPSPSTPQGETDSSDTVSYLHSSANSETGSYGWETTEDHSTDTRICIRNPPDWGYWQARDCQYSHGDPQARAD